MKKWLVGVVTALSLMIAAPSMATDYYDGDYGSSASAKVEGEVYTPDSWYEYKTGYNGGEDYSYGGGYAGHKFKAKGEGSRFASALAGGVSSMDHEGFAFQKEVNGGELSGAVSKTTANGFAGGIAIGKDSRYKSRDFAEVDVKITLHPYQENGAYSDDRNSWVSGWNWSRTHAEARAYDRDTGPDGRLAFAEDHVAGEAVVKGGTLVYAKQTDTKAFVGGITASKSEPVEFCGAECGHVSVAGGGYIDGYAVLPNVGYAGFDASYGYSGPNSGGGVAGGVAGVKTTSLPNGGVSVVSGAAAFSGVSVGGCSDCDN